jgi:hypothetical protein
MRAWRMGRGGMMGMDYRKKTGEEGWAMSLATGALGELWLHFLFL